MIMQELICFCTLNKTKSNYCFANHNDLFFSFDNSICSILCSLYLVIAKEKINECKDCRESETYTIIKQVTIKEYENNKYFNEIVEAYVDAIYYISAKKINFDANDNKSNNIVQNIIFLMDKNLYTTRTSEIAKKYISSDVLYNNFAKKTNNNYIMANSENTKYFEQVCKKYISILEGTDVAKKACVIAALREIKLKKSADNTKNDDRYLLFSFTEQQINNILDEIKMIAYNGEYQTTKYDLISENLMYNALKGLEDYSVDFRGDIGSNVRIEALRLLSESETNKIENYLIRYLVDKCVKLRKEALKILSKIKLSNNLQEFYNKYKETYINKLMNSAEQNEINKIDKKSQINMTYQDKMNKNDVNDKQTQHSNTAEENNKNMQDCDFDKQIECLNENIHFCTILSLLDMLNENYVQDFCIGYFCTFKNCSSTLFEMLLTKSGESMKITKTAFVFFEKEKRYLLLSAYFLYEMYKLNENEKIKSKVQEIVTQNKNKKYGGRVKEIIQKILEKQDETWYK
ncbi:hypothetical protein BDAP_002231 [Binucleata daphniae]